MVCHLRYLQESYTIPDSQPSSEKGADDLYDSIIVQEQKYDGEEAWRAADDGSSLRTATPRAARDAPHVLSSDQPGGVVGVSNPMQGHQSPQCSTLTQNRVEEHLRSARDPMWSRTGLKRQHSDFENSTCFLRGRFLLY